MDRMNDKFQESLLILELRFFIRFPNSNIIK